MSKRNKDRRAEEGRFEYGREYTFEDAQKTADKLYFNILSALFGVGKDKLEVCTSLSLDKATIEVLVFMPISKAYLISEETSVGRQNRAALVTLTIQLQVKFGRRMFLFFEPNE